MPAKSPIEIFELSGWGGGLNTEASPSLLAPDELREVKNVDIGLNGEVRVRKGWVELTAKSPHSIAIWAWNGHVIHMTSGGAFFTYNEGAGTSDDTNTLDFGDVTSGNEQADFQVAAQPLDGKLYFTSLRCRDGGVPKSFDGSTWADLTEAGFDGTSGKFPVARTLLAAHNRMFAANIVESGGTERPSRLHFSEPLEPETWEANNWFDVAPDDGQQISALALFGDQILIFKERAIYTLVGTSPAEFGVFPIDKGFGTTAGNTIEHLGSLLVFYDPETGVWTFNGADFNRISDKINSRLLDNVPREWAHRANAYVYRNRYFLSVPWDAADEELKKTFVYDPRLQAWTEYAMAVQDAAIEGKDIFGTSPDGDTPSLSSAIVELFSGQTDGGVGFTSLVKTGWLSPVSLGHRHRLRRIDLMVTVNDDSDDLSFWTLHDESESLETAYSLNLTKVGAAEQQHHKITDGLGGRFNTIGLQFSDFADFWQVDRVALHVSAHRRRGAP